MRLKLMSTFIAQIVMAYILPDLYSNSIDKLHLGDYRRQLIDYSKNQTSHFFLLQKSC